MGERVDGDNKYDGDDGDTMESRARIVDSVYQHIVQSVCIDVAGNIHEFIKTTRGDLPSLSNRIFGSTDHESGDRGRRLGMTGTTGGTSPAVAVLVSAKMARILELD